MIITCANKILDSTTDYFKTACAATHDKRISTHCHSETYIHDIDSPLKYVKYNKSKLQQKL